jgi:hypothetical protein
MLMEMRMEAFNLEALLASIGGTDGMDKGEPSLEARYSSRIGL